LYITIFAINCGV